MTWGSLGTRVLTHPRISTQILNILKCLHSTHLLGCLNLTPGQKTCFMISMALVSTRSTTFWPQSSSIKNSVRHLVVSTPLKNDGVRQWGWDDIPYMKWKIIQSCLKPPTSHGFSKSSSVERLLLSHGVLSFQTRNTRRAGEF